ncbi:YjgB family protein [Paenibacillus lemnae]|uniref:YjgB family protein n=1 Tax=Paenibacillus lemnae TaxID=1330551 RepID=A0A848M6N3_PAELE|nr:YjgB family protein [Paenibacillus lemnae]NMO95752.1 YjgB family protein [Paenibacillus lemnae]
MNINTISKSMLIALTAGAVSLSSISLGASAYQAEGAALTNGTNYSQADASAASMAQQKLNSFYKPALKGQFPGAVSGLTVGKSTRQEVYQTIGNPPKPDEGENRFDLYTAHMGNPGYAVSYNKDDVISEIRYFGTNVERQTNIGGITKKMLKQNWYAPSSSETIYAGQKAQSKLTYNRGEYKLEFIFNSSIDLDHINLVER